MASCKQNMTRNRATISELFLGDGNTAVADSEECLASGPDAARSSKLMDSVLQLR